MRTEEFYNAIREKTANESTLSNRIAIPLGITEGGEIVYSRTRETAYSIRHTCVTGEEHTSYVKRLVLLLTALCGRDACFVVLSKKADYAELLRLKNANVTVLYARTTEQLEKAKTALSSMVEQSVQNAKAPKLFLVLDGLEQESDSLLDKDLKNYREIMEICRNTAVEVITGVSLMQSIFSGYPGAFVGVGNALIDLREKGVADVTYVEKDASLSLPVCVTVPSQPAVSETVLLWNEIIK